MKMTPSGSQTVGPFFRIGLEHLCAPADAVIAGSADRVTIRGRVRDGAGSPVPDAALEFWHADARGSYDAAPAHDGRPACFTRVATDDDGFFSFSIQRPGAVAGDDGQPQAPHLDVLVFARGLLRHLMTRMYFPGEPANAADPVLQSVPESRRHTLMATADAREPLRLEWDVVLQGEKETVFFAW